MGVQILIHTFTYIDSDATELLLSSSVRYKAQRTLAVKML